MKNLVVAFLFVLISSVSALSQDSLKYHLEIILQDEYGMGISDIDSVNVTVFNDDTLCFFRNAEYSIKVDLPEGKYTIKAEGAKHYAMNILDVAVRSCCLSHVVVVMNYTDILCDENLRREREPALMRV